MIAIPFGRAQIFYIRSLGFAMRIQLDAAQVIDLIDDDDNELRHLLSGHQCAISSSVVLDLFKKTDRPSRNYYGAFRELSVSWGVDAGVLCNTEIKTGIELLSAGVDSRSNLHACFPFRASILDAISVRLGVPVPAEFATKGFGDLMCDPFAKIVMKIVAEQYYKGRMEYWRNSLTRSTQERGPDFLVALRVRVGELYEPNLSEIIEGVDIETLQRLFPAFMLAWALRQVCFDDRRTKWKDNDIVDLFHILLSPYCNYTFCDGNMYRRLERTRQYVPWRTHYVANADVKPFLRQLRKG